MRSLPCATRMSSGSARLAGRANSACAPSGTFCRHSTPIARLSSRRRWWCEAMAVITPRSNAADQRPQRLAIADHNGAPTGIHYPGGTPEGELLVDRFAAGADHAAEVVLRQRYRNLVLERSAVMLGQHQ